METIKIRKDFFKSVRRPPGTGKSPDWNVFLQYLENSRLFSVSGL